MIIGISGYARSGKDTVADYLQVKYGYSIRSFATPLKAAAAAMFGFSPHQLGHGKDEFCADHGITPREALQHLGDVMRARYGQDFFARRALSTAYGKRTVFADVRHKEEVDAIRAVGGIILRVERAGRGPVNSHGSEIALDNHYFEAVFSNDGLLTDLFKQVDAFMLTV